MAELAVQSFRQLAKGDGCVPELCVLGLELRQATIHQQALPALRFGFTSAVLAHRPVGRRIVQIHGVGSPARGEREVLTGV